MLFLANISFSFCLAEILNLKFDDTEAAAEWYRKAINNGKQEAKQKLNEMLARKSKQDAAPNPVFHFSQMNRLVSRFY